MNKKHSISQLLETMSQLRKLLDSKTKESHEEKSATIMQYAALVFLKSNKSATVGDIASHLKLSKSSATQLIERLVKSALVKRIDDENDRRIVRLMITTAGEQSIMDMKKNYIQKMEKLLSKIPENDLQELVRIQTELIKTLQKEQNE